jgi:hypothetical protein
MKKIMFNLLPAVFLWFGMCQTGNAQDVAQSDQITQGGQIIQDDDSTTGKFEPVTVDGFTTSDVALQFPATLANKSVIVQTLDGGTLGIDGSSATIGADGSLGFSFQVSDQPGVYRVVVIDPNATEDVPPIVGVVQFEIPPPAE